MAQFTLTTRQQKTIGLLIDKAVSEQEAVASTAEALAFIKGRRDTRHADMEQAMAEIGKPTGAIRNVTKDMEPDGSWAGKITVT